MATGELSPRHMAFALLVALGLHGALLWHFSMPQPVPERQELRVQVLAAVAEMASRNAPQAPVPPPQVERGTPPPPPEPRAQTEARSEPLPEPPPLSERPPLQEPLPVAEPQPPREPEPLPEEPEPVTELQEPLPPVESEPLPEALERVVNAAPQPEAAVIDSEALVQYESLLLAWLERHKHYPRRAQRLRIEGEGRLRIRIDGEGKTVTLELERSTGNRLLDRAALDMARRAAPYPPPPKADGELEFVVPVVFALR